MRIEAGSVYKVKHKSKGNFLLAVKYTDEYFTMGMIIEGKLAPFHEGHEVSAADVTTVKNSFCEFERVQINKESKS